MSSQLELFEARGELDWPVNRPEKVFTLTPDEVEYIENLKARDIRPWPEPLLAEMKCRRMGISLAEFYAVPSYIWRGWLSQESFDLAMPGTEYIKHWEPSPEVIELKVNLEARELERIHARAFEIASQEIAQRPLLAKP